MAAPGITTEHGSGAGTTAPVLRLTGLGWGVGGATIVEDITLDVREGEFLAFIGPNGAGKTSLFNLISGLTTATSGTIALDGTDMTGRPAHAGPGAGSAGRSRHPASGRG